MAANNSSTGKWNNEKCIEIALSENFPSSVKDIKVQKSIIERYFNFYLGAKLRKGLKVTDLAFAVISIMPQHEQTESLIWESQHYKEDGALFHLTPEEKLRVEVDSISANENKQTHSKVADKNVNTKQEVISAPKANISNSEEIIENEMFDLEINHTDEFNIFNEISSFQENRHDTVDSPSAQVAPEFAPAGPSPSTSNQSFSSTKQTNQSLTSSDFSDVPKIPQNLHWFSRWPGEKVKEEDPPYYGPVENSAFSASCDKILKEWDTNVKGRIVLKYLFGIIALVTMRATTKKYMHLFNTFRSRKFLTHITFAKGYVNYSIPHKRFIKNSYRTFTRRDGKVPAMFAKLVVNSFHIDSVRRIQPKGLLPKLNVIKLTVLSHSADYGFGLVTMLQNIESKIGVTGVNHLLEATYSADTALSWNKLLDFLNTYLSGKSKEGTHHWARVINKDYFGELTCANNYTLSVILGVLIEQLTNNSNIWQSAWVGAHPDNIQELKDRGYKIFKKMKLEGLI